MNWKDWLDERFDNYSDYQSINHLKCAIWQEFNKLMDEEWLKLEGIVNKNWKEHLKNMKAYDEGN